MIETLLPIDKSYYNGYSPNLFEGFLLIGYDEINLQKLNKTKVNPNTAKKSMWLIEDIDPTLRPEVLFSLYNNPDRTSIKDYNEDDMISLFFRSMSNLQKLDKEIEKERHDCNIIIFQQQEEEEISSKASLPKSSNIIYGIGYYFKERIDFSYQNSISLYVPKCFIFLSKYPFFSQYYYLAQKLNKINNDNTYGNNNEKKLNEIPLEVYLNNLIKQCHAPISFDIQIENENNFILFPILTCFPIIDFNLKEVLCLLPINYLLEVFVLSLFDINIYFISENKEKVLFLIYALECLKYPFGFQLSQSCPMITNDFEEIELSTSSSISSSLNSSTQIDKSSKDIMIEMHKRTPSDHDKTIGNNSMNIKGCFWFKNMIDGLDKSYKSSPEGIIVELDNPSETFKDKWKELKNPKYKNFMKAFKKELSKGKTETRFGELRDSLEKEIKGDIIKFDNKKSSSSCGNVNKFDWRYTINHKENKNKSIQSIFYDFIIYLFTYVNYNSDDSNKKHSKKVFLDESSFFSLFDQTKTKAQCDSIMIEKNLSVTNILFKEMMQLKLVKDIYSYHNKNEFNTNAFIDYSQIMHSIYYKNGEMNSNKRKQSITFVDILQAWLIWKKETGHINKEIDDKELNLQTNKLLNINYKDSFEYHIYLNNLDNANKRIFIRDNYHNTFKIPFLDLVNIIEEQYFKQNILNNIQEKVFYCFLMMLQLSIDKCNFKNICLFKHIMQEIVNKNCYFISKYLLNLLMTYHRLILNMQNLKESEHDTYCDLLSSSLHIQSHLATNLRRSFDYEQIVNLLSNEAIKVDLQNERKKEESKNQLHSRVFEILSTINCGHIIYEDIDILKDSQEMYKCKKCCDNKYLFISIPQYSFDKIQLLSISDLYERCYIMCNEYMKDFQLVDCFKQDYKIIMINLSFYMFYLPRKKIDSKPFEYEFYYFFHQCFTKIIEENQ